jgi:hypothetical protein
MLLHLLFMQNNDIVNLIMDNDMWKHMVIVLRAILPGLVVLRLADSNKPGMDKLYHYVLRLDTCLANSKKFGYLGGGMFFGFLCQDFS